MKKRVEFPNVDVLTAGEEIKRGAFVYLKNMMVYNYTIEETKARELEGEEIKIRYAYIASPTTSRIDPAYCETLRFKVLTIAELEIRPNRIDFDELITDNKEAVIRILGRDRCTGRRDMNGRDIYENDIIRWFPTRLVGYKDVLVRYESNMFVLGEWEGNWVPGTEIHSKVMGTIYEKLNYQEGE